ncbi:MAG: SIMPL domain-containing protein [Actinomycetota bacterium]
MGSDRRNVKRMALSALLLGAVALIGAALLGPTLAVGQTDAAGFAETVTVGAAGRVEGRPDLAKVIFGIHAEDPSAAAAMDKLADKTQRVFDALRGAGLNNEQIETLDVSLNRQFERRDGRSVFVGYAASTGVQARTRDLDRVGELIDVGVEAGADSIRHVSFERTNENEALLQALRQAMELARTKAEALATTAGRQLGRALVINEAGQRQPQPLAVAAPFAAAGGTTLPINPPTQATVVRIVVTFALQ